MVYYVEILKVDFFNAYEGRLWIKCGSQSLYVAHQIPLEGARNHLIPGRILLVDLWLFYANSTRSSICQKQLPQNSNIVGGILRGQVKNVFNLNEFRVDCGELEIDILNDYPITLSKNDYIETAGSYYIFLPNTEYSKEELWG